MNIKNTLRMIREDRTFILILLDILFFIAPGIAAIFFYRSNLFTSLDVRSLDWARLILLSITVTSPLVFWNTILVGTFLRDGTAESKDELFVDFSMGILLTGLLIYAAIMVSYFWNRSFHEAAMFIAGVEIAVLFAAAIKDYRDSKKT